MRELIILPFPVDRNVNMIRSHSYQDCLVYGVEVGCCYRGVYYGVRITVSASSRIPVS